MPSPADQNLDTRHKVAENPSEVWLFTAVQNPSAPPGNHLIIALQSQSAPPFLQNTSTHGSAKHLLGPFIVTPRSPLPAALVSTLKSAVSLMRTPLGCRPLPVARQAFGLQAARQFQASVQALSPHTLVAHPACNNLRFNVDSGQPQLSFLHEF